MQKPIYLLFSGARQLFLFNCYRAREENKLEEEKSLLSFSPRVRARVLETSPFALKTGTCSGYASCKRCDILTSCRELHTYLQFFMRPILRP